VIRRGRRKWAGLKGIRQLPAWRLELPGSPAFASLIVTRCDVVSEQLPSKVELSGTTTFRASDALASNYICREASIIHFTRAMGIVGR
jgi:hypothetical protein